MDSLIQIRVTDLDHQVHQIEAPTDMNLNLMEAMRANGLPVKATCGGMALCATCHVLVLSNHNLPPMSEDEEAMLDQAFLLNDSRSRLSCQLHITTELNGLEVQLGTTTGD